MGLSIWQILIVVVLVILLFGRGKISDLMGDVAQGIKSFRKGMSDDDAGNASAGKTIEGESVDGNATVDAKDTAQRETLKN
ncbi:twin-arginine translocase TatA/TatE family subunit [Pyruvatibacter sp.]|uniref:twin-arginine translocase TatA/TatE family subunit n=1 Tax=unclassified Pyruvatibacter TaxID=2618840 RepID=UPI002967858A|nr:twin-arginine translocase TatA/TatE family subunit [Alphaproteobacteria bacterium]